MYRKEFQDYPGPIRLNRPPLHRFFWEESSHWNLNPKIGSKDSRLSFKKKEFVTISSFFLICHPQPKESYIEGPLRITFYSIRFTSCLLYFFIVRPYFFFKRKKKGFHSIHSRYFFVILFTFPLNEFLKLDIALYREYIHTSLSTKIYIANKNT